MSSKLLEMKDIKKSFGADARSLGGEHQRRRRRSASAARRERRRKVDPNQYPWRNRAAGQRQHRHQRRNRRGVSERSGRSPSGGCGDPPGDRPGAPPHGGGEHFSRARTDDEIGPQGQQAHRQEGPRGDRVSRARPRRRDAGARAVARASANGGDRQGGLPGHAHSRDGRADLVTVPSRGRTALRDCPATEKERRRDHLHLASARGNLQRSPTG